MPVVPPRLLRALGLALALLPARGAPARAEAETAPFPGDYSWMNGSNDQPASLLQSGPLTWSLMLDTYYGYAFNRPTDHTVFPTTTAPRHNEIGLNLGVLGVEATGLPNVLGKLVLQTGHYVEAITGADPTAGRGAYAGLGSLRLVQQAYLGYHLDVASGLNLMAGLFPSFIGPDSYWPQENWNYTHNVIADSTPYYVQGAVAQLYPVPQLKTELWAVNGWQTLSKFNEGWGFGYLVNWRPTGRLSLQTAGLGGAVDVDPGRRRFHTDHGVQWKYAEAPFPGVALAAVQLQADLGYVTAGASAPDAWMSALSLSHHTVFNERWASGLRVSTISDPQKLMVLAPPGGAALAGGDLRWSELTVGLDYKPEPWLLCRLEYRKDLSSLPYVAGPGGLIAPVGAAGFTPDFVTGGDRVTLNATLRL